MARGQYKKVGSNEFIVCTHTVDVDNTDHAGIRWYQLKKTTGNWTLNQEGTYAPDGESRWMGSIAMNDYGQIALAYSVSGTVNPEIRYTGQTSCAQNGTLDVTEQTITTSLTPKSQPSYNRWGDYFLTTVDPSDNLTFWSTLEYYNGGKKTQIFSYKIDESCNAPTISTVSSTSLFRDKGKEITITGTDFLGCSFVFNGITGTEISNNGTTAVINFPPANYDNSNLLIVSNAIGSDNVTVSANTRTTIPVVSGAPATSDNHGTIQSACDGLFGWLGTSVFSSPIIIDVAAGTYSESISLNNGLNPTTTNTLTIQNSPGTSPVVDATGNNYGFNLGTVNYVTLKGFAIHSADNSNIYAQGNNVFVKYNKTYNAVGDNSGSGLAGGNGIKIETGTAMSVLNNISYGNIGNGIELLAANSVIKNNTCDNNGGFVIHKTGVTLFNETFADASLWTTTSWGIYIGTVFDPTPSKEPGAGINNATDYLTLTNPIDITGYTNLNFSIWIISYGNLENQDVCRAQYSFDNSTWVDIANLSNDNATFTEYTLNGVTPTSNSLYLRVYGKVNTSEYWLIDDFVVTGDENFTDYYQGNSLLVSSGTGSTVENNIFSAKSGQNLYYSLKLTNSSSVNSNYNTYYSPNLNVYDNNSTLGTTGGPLGANDITSDPMFVGGGDYHLQSTTGSYTTTKAPVWPPDAASGGVWSNDLNDSPAIVGGNADSFANEPMDNGGKINQGAYGNTAQASKAPPLPCVTPSTQTSSFTASAASSSSIDLTWTRGDGDNVIILAHEAAVVNADPVSGTSYTANSVFSLGNSIDTENYVVYSGTGNSVTVTGLTANTSYYFAAYEFNNTNICYLTPGVTANAATPSTPPTITNVSPSSFFADKGATLTITGSDLTGAAINIAGVTGTVTSNDGSTIVVDFAPGLYTNNILTVSTGVVPDATATVTVNTRNIIPVGGGTDFHTTIQSALDGLFAWFGTAAFNTSTAGYLAGTKTVEVYSGTYTETVTPNVTLGTTATEGIIIQNATGNAPVIDATGLNNAFYIGVLDYVTVSGFTAYNSTDALIYTEGDNNVIQLNKLYGSAGGAGIILNAALSSTVQNNLVYNNYTFGIRLIASDNAFVKNNTIANNGNEAKAPPLPSVYTPAQLYVESGTGTSVENNIFYAKTGTNIFTLMTESGITVSSDYNTYFKNGNTSLVYYNGTVYTDLTAWSGNGAGTNDLEGDPLFVIAGTDFHIHSTNGSYPYPAEWPPEAAASAWNNDAGTSPALDTGNPADTYTNEPVSGGRINQGAYGNTSQASKSAGLLWDGSTSTDWQTTTNWTPEQIPTSTDDIIIPDGMPNYPIIDDGTTTAVCNNMTIAANASVTIATNGQMTVSGSITNNAGTAGLIVKSDVNGDGSLIVNNTVVATVERFVTGNKWHLMFPTLSAIATNTYTTEGSDVNYNFYSYNEANEDYWNTANIYGVTGWTSEVPASNIRTDKGYLFNRYNLADKTFVQTGGNLAFDNKIFNVDYTVSTIAIGNGVTQSRDYFDGWNLTGNPYTSAIDWDQITFNGIENGIYYFDGTNYQYYIPGGGSAPYDIGITLNSGSRYIPSGQGFMVKVTNTGVTHNTTFTIPASAKIHNGQTYWKNTVLIPNLIKLNVKKDGFTDEMIVRTLPTEFAATEEHDAKYDAYKMFSWDNTKPQIYTVSNDFKTIFAINTLPEFTDNKVIPIGIYIGAAGQYEISSTENNFTGFNVYLYDIAKNISTNITNDASYTFESETGTFTDRFELVFEKSATNLGNIEQNTVQIYPNPNEGSFYLTVNNTTDKYRVEISNVTGQLIYQNRFNNSGTKEIKLKTVSNGIYFVKIILGNNRIVTKKIVID